MVELKKVFTWQELAKHNTRKSAWVAVYGKVYDVTEWISRHPGGEDVVLLAAGRDATQVFETYHERYDFAEKVLKKYEIGQLISNELPVYPKRGKFYQDLKKRLDSYFEKTKQDPKFHWMQIVRYFLVYSTVALSYYAQFYYGPVRDSYILSFVSAVVLGFACAQVGLLPLHDASHCSFGHSPWLWRILGASHDFINGCSYLNWCYQHQLGHHPYTNVENADPDIVTAEGDVRRIKESQPWHKRYIKQELFVPVLYGALGMKVRIQDVNLLFVEKMNDQIRVNPVETWHLLAFWLGKAFFVFYRFVLPMMYSGLTWKAVLFQFLIADLTASYWLAFTFQANHVVTGVDFPKPNEKKEISKDWAELQVLTAQDYAHKSYFWTNLAGALNYQVVHHLFPNICQHYYMEIAPIVVQACKEHNVRYVVKDTYAEAISGHLEHLKKLGLNEKIM